MQPCPGGCGTSIMADLVACRPCLNRLPADLRREVLPTPSGPRAADSARGWLGRHQAEMRTRHRGLHR